MIELGFIALSQMMNWKFIAIKKKFNYKCLKISLTVNEKKYIILNIKLAITTVKVVQ